jgi:hypothetical protein
MQIGDTIVVLKGSRELGIPIRSRAVVEEIFELGEKYSHQTKVVIRLRGQRIGLVVCHKNRLEDPEFNLLSPWYSHQKIRCKKG